MSCIFCKIVAGELPAARILEDERALAFMDINPASKGHALVIPKRHSQDLFDADPEDLAAVARMSQAVARRIEAVISPDGVNIVQNNRPAAGQVVMHYHMHIIPRWQDDGVLGLWRPKSPDADLQDLAAKLRAAE